MFYGNPTSTSGNYLYGNVSIPSGQNTGYYDLEVYDYNTGNWVMLNNAFEVNSSAQSPQIYSISPSSAGQGDYLGVTISGSYIDLGSQWSPTSSIRFTQYSGVNTFYGTLDSWYDDSGPYELMYIYYN